VFKYIGRLMELHVARREIFFSSIAVANIVILAVPVKSEWSSLS